MHLIGNSKLIKITPRYPSMYLCSRRKIGFVVIVCLQIKNIDETNDPNLSSY